VSDVLIVTLATESWVRDCIDLVGDDEFAEEVGRVPIVYARDVQDKVEVWARLNMSYEDAVHNFGTLVSSTTWDPELRAHMVNAKMAAMQRGLAYGCEQVISIGDSEIERWAAHDLPFNCGDAPPALVKTIKFEEGLQGAALAEMLRTTASFLKQFVRLSVEMDIGLRSGDALFPMDLQFAMQAAARPQDFAEPLLRSSREKRGAWRSHEL
jgi:hypothetical protein